MKRIITLLLIGMLAFSAFASTTILNIEATVAKINPTYSIEGKITYKKNEGKDAKDTSTTASATSDIVSVDEGKATTANLKADNIRLTSGTEVNNVDRDDDTFIVEVSLIQTEARYSGNIAVEFTFSELSYDNTKNGKTVDTTATYKTDFPTLTQAYTRPGTLALNVGSLTTTDKTGKGTVNLEYTILGYFIKDGTKLTTVKATYTIPPYVGDTSSTAYLPFGKYSGTVTVTITDRS